MNLRELRTSKGKSQSDLGSQSLISLYEHGLARPGFKMIRHLADELSCTTEEIFAACEKSREEAKKK